MLKKFLLLILSLALCPPALSAAERPIIDIASPTIRKLPVALPAFAPQSEQTSSPALEQGRELLSQDLLFTGLFDIIDPASYLGTAEEEVNPRQWSRVGAELLITCRYQREGSVLTLECRLYDILEARQLVGKRYSGQEEDLPAMMHRFADEIMLAVTGERSVFSTLIAFVHSEGNNKNIWLMDFNGANPRPFTQKEGLTLYPAWDPAGSLLAYSQFVNRHPAVFVHSLAGGGGRMIINSSGMSITPAFRPGGQIAASLSYGNGPTNIFLSDLTGQIVKNLSNGLNIDVTPSFSPDGGQMAFVSDRGGAPQIYILDLNSGQTRRLTFGYNYCAAPDWSPKGDLIAFQARTENGFRIATVKPDGSGLQVLDTPGGEDPSFSPDGRLIAYSSRTTGAYQIYVVTASGQMIGQISNLSGDNSDPAWSPRGLGGK
ncbi:MAG: Tol-Pal system beta propeller repeat protein TolB [Desulfarculales bacterium]|jgi:TolB protein|nr:Tol-Pal system beta propeller repeat protein TolB [Desulfarculales bacterium]